MLLIKFRLYQLQTYVAKTNSHDSNNGLYYYEEMTLKEISLVLNLTEARISQLHTKAIFRMRGYLAQSKGDLF